MTIPRELRLFAAAKAIAEKDRIAAGMQAKAQEFNRAGGEFYIPIASDTTAR